MNQSISISEIATAFAGSLFSYPFMHAGFLNLTQTVLPELAKEPKARYGSFTYGIVLARRRGRDGFWSMYRGMGPMVLSEVLMSHGVQQVEHKRALGMFSKDGTPQAVDSAFDYFLSHFSASTGTSFISYPLRLISINLMADLGEAKLYTGPIDCLQKIYEQEGIRGFYEGFGYFFLYQILNSVMATLSATEKLSDWKTIANEKKEMLSAGSLQAGSNPLGHTGWSMIGNAAAHFLWTLANAASWLSCIKSPHDCEVNFDYREEMGLVLKSDISSPFALIGAPAIGALFVILGTIC
jgi:hypothetical protein